MKLVKVCEKGNAKSRIASNCNQKEGMGRKSSSVVNNKISKALNKPKKDIYIRTREDKKGESL